MAGPDRIEGLAIVSADGMIADSAGVQPDALWLEADQRFFHAHLDAASALAHGRYSGEGGPNAARRRRLVLTRTVAGVARDPQNALAVHWNPAGATLDQAWEALGYLLAAAEIVCALMVLVGLKARWGALILAVFTACTIIFVHHFWDMEGAALLQHRGDALKDLSILGGLLLIVAVGSGPGSVENR